MAFLRKTCFVTITVLRYCLGYVLWSLAHRPWRTSFSLFLLLSSSSNTLSIFSTSGAIFRTCKSLIPLFMSLWSSTCHLHMQLLSGKL
ncbi:uncharacterized protein EDB93DRAFT_1172445, partial [Suillus bovinus]|uniref:uncharacterized protein n=1 Tax=Suillus bovinus TaxID=48563 RepID=UPI001B876C28